MSQFFPSVKSMINYGIPETQTARESFLFPLRIGWGLPGHVADSRDALPWAIGPQGPQLIRGHTVINQILSHTHHCRNMQVLQTAAL